MPSWRGYCQIGLKVRIFAVAHCIVAAAGAIELVRNHEWQRSFLAAVHLPPMIKYVHTGVRRRRKQPIAAPAIASFAHRLRGRLQSGAAPRTSSDGRRSFSPRSEVLARLEPSRPRCFRDPTEFRTLGSFLRPSSAHCAVRSTAQRPNASSRGYCLKPDCGPILARSLFARRQRGRIFKVLVIAERRWRSPRGKLDADFRISMRAPNSFAHTSRVVQARLPKILSFLLLRQIQQVS